MQTSLGPQQNFLGVEKSLSTFDRAKAVILSVPYQRASGSGPRSGPAAILKASRELEHYDEETGRTVASEAGICTLAPFNAGSAKEGAVLTKLNDLVSDLLARDKFVVMLGGEHMLTAASAAAYAQRHPNLSVLQFDAHADLRADHAGSTFAGACVMARVCEFLEPRRLVQAGVRSMNAEEADTIREQGIHTYLAHHIKSGFHTRLLKYWDDSLVDDLTEDVYVTIDVDVFDPSIMPSTCTPEPNGLSWMDVVSCLKKVSQKRRIVGCDIVGLSPIKGLRHPDLTVAKLVSKILTYAVA